MRVALDTNVVVSALLWRGTPYRLIGMIARQPKTRLFTSPALLMELADVLARPMAVSRLALAGVSLRQALLDYTDATEIVLPPAAIPRIVIDDPDDDHVIAAAVAAHADLLVSGDRHLRALGSHGPIRILNPAEAARLIEVG